MAFRGSTVVPLRRTDPLARAADLLHCHEFSRHHGLEPERRMMGPTCKGPTDLQLEVKASPVPVTQLHENHGVLPVSSATSEGYLPWIHPS